MFERMFRIVPSLGCVWVNRQPVWLSRKGNLLLLLMLPEWTLPRTLAARSAGLIRLWVSLYLRELFRLGGWCGIVCILVCGNNFHL